YYASRGPSVFGGEVAGEHAKFLDGIERHVSANIGGELVTILAAIEQNVGTGGALSIDGKPEAAKVLCLGSGHITCRSHQVVRIARDRRQLGDLLLVDHL